MNNLILNENYKYWLGGFIEGEGSLTISIVKSKKAPYGFLLQPEFNVTQHKNGLSILNSFKLLFNGKGQIFKKSGSNNVWVYSLKGINNLREFIVPFYSKYIVDYSSKYKYDEFIKFVCILNKLSERSRLDKDEFINIIKLIYLLNPDSKGKKRKRTLLEVISIIKDINCNN